MRAIIKTATNIEPEELDAFLGEIDWWPALPQNHPEVERRKKEILDHVSDEDRTICEPTLKYTIYDEATRSWGIVNTPNKHGVTFRIKNPDSEKLKIACERFIGELQKASAKHKDGNIRFRFTSKIEVLEPGSTNHAYSGEVLPSNRLLLAIQDKKTEFWVALISGIVAFLLLLFTFPPIQNSVLNGLSKEYTDWIAGFLSRLSTSAIVTSTVSFLNIFLYWTDIRRRSIIKWSLD